MGNRNIHKTIRSLQERIHDHQAKIASELPDSPLVAYWEREIKAWTERVLRLEDRLARRTSRGSRRRS